MKDIIIPVKISDLTFKNPFFVASGPTTKSVKQLLRIEETGWAAASIKLTIAPVPYLSRKPRYGMFNDWNALAFTTEKRLAFEEGLRLVEDGKKVLKDLLLFANITYAGDEGVPGWVDMSKKFEEAGADVIELNMCCPNMSYNLQLTTGDHEASAKKTGASLGQHGDAVAEIVRAIKKEVKIPVFVKLTPEGGKIAEVSKTLFAAGADAVGGTANRMGMSPINLDNPKASPFHFQDEISMACHCGPWLKPLARRDTYEIRKVCGEEARIMSAGGVATWEDAVQMIMCGADLVGVCSETLISGYDIVRPMIEGLKVYMDKRGDSDVRQLRGLIVSEVKTASEVTQYEGYAKIKEPYLAAPCKTACPHNVPAQAYIKMIAKRDFKAAYDLLSSKNPLQMVCSFICNHACESECTRGITGRSLQIKDLKRFILEHGEKQGWDNGSAAKENNGKRVAVVGSGPAGLSCAWSLVREGYGVTVFEREDTLGGALRMYIPEFRLPGCVLDKQLEALRKAGIEFKTGVEFGVDITADTLLEQGYGSVFLAIGAQKSRPLGIPGEDATGVISPLALLKQSNKDHKLGDVVVVGGGFTAVDAARAAVRMGAGSVYIAYRRTKDEMPATIEEITQAEAEGIRILYLAAPVCVITENGKVAGLEMCVQTLGSEDDSHRRRPEQLDGADFVIKCDTIIPAIGQIPENCGITTKKDMIAVDPVSLRTGTESVYAGGDAVEVDSVISAIAAGKRAAVSIDRQLMGQNATLSYEQNCPQVSPADVLSRTPYFIDNLNDKNDLEFRTANERKNDFEPFERCMTEEEAVEEASRCLSCGCGEGCQKCKTICCDFAPEIIDVDTVGINKDDCVACGMCYNICPNKNIEMILSEA